MITSVNVQAIGNLAEGVISKKIQKGFIKYLHFPHEISKNRSRKYGIYCPNLDYEREKHLFRSPSVIKRMKFIRSSMLKFLRVRGFVRTLAEAQKKHSAFNQYISKELNNLSRMITDAKNLHSFTLYLDIYDLLKDRGLGSICKKLKSLKKVSSMNVRLSSNKMNEAKVEELLKILAIQKKLSKLDISYYGDSIMKTGFIYLNKNIASCQNLSDLRVCFVPSSKSSFCDHKSIF